MNRSARWTIGIIVLAILLVCMSGLAMAKGATLTNIIVTNTRDDLLVYLSVEGAFTLGQRGLIGGPDAIGWRVMAQQEYGFNPRFFDLALERGIYPPEFLRRFVTYPFVHVSFTHAIFAGAMLLALGKMVGEVFGGLATLALFFGSAIGGVVVYAVLLDAPIVIVGAFPAVYGFIGAFTYTLWLRLGELGETQLRAFTLIGFLMGIQLLFGLLFGGTSDWVADIAAFAVGFVMSMFLIPGGWARIRERIQR